LWPHLTVSQNVAFALQRRGSNRDQIAEKVSALLHRLGIDQLASRFPNELSGGEQQRVALARALAAEVGLILFDEPLSNLDADRRESLRIEIATLARESGATVVYITHDQSEAYALADVIGVLSAGTLVQWGTPENVYREPATPFVARFTGLAGELPVHVEHRRDGRADVTLLLDTPVVVRDCPTNTTVGDDATMFVRPSAVQLHHSASGSGFWMNITDSAFVGRGYEHVGVTDGEIRFTKIFSTERFERGSRAWVTLDTQAVYVMNERSA